MNSENLLSALSKLGDGPETVQRIRKVVVGLAISGKLAGGNSASPVSRLAEIVDQASTAAIFRTGRLNERSHSEVTADRLPEFFNDPSRFVSLGDIATIKKGLTSIQQSKPGPFPLVVTAAERASSDHYDFEGAAAIIPLVSSTGHGNASINRLHYQEGRFALGTILAAAFPHEPDLTSARFLFEYLSAFKDELLVTRMTGTANVALSIGRIAEVPVPLICPDVQEKVDELMVLCDRLEKAREEREATRDRFAAATFARLNAPDPETFRNDAQFALGALPVLTARPNQVKQLRQTILNLAVQGKLVPQDPGEESVQKLVARLAAEKIQLQKERGIRPDAPIPPIDTEELPFAVPASWTWARAQDLSLKISDGVHQKPNYVTAGVPFITVKNLTEGAGISFRDAKFISERDHQEFVKRTHPEQGDLLITKDGTIGVARVVETGRAFSIFVSVALMKMVFSELASFLALCVNSPVVRDTIVPKGAALKHLHLVELRKLPLPLPPLNEQRRIVAKVNQLMKVCDDLEASLTKGDDTRVRLLDALLVEALAPARGREMQAAE